MDTEFVLGSSPVDGNTIRRIVSLDDTQHLAPGSSTYEHSTNPSADFKKRLIGLWLLDFDAAAISLWTMSEPPTVPNTPPRTPGQGAAGVTPSFPREFWGGLRGALRR